MIDQLPAPPKGKKGWPWTVESDPPPATMPNGEPWPRISLVTPSYNQGRYIEETIRSVLLQNYPNLEYVIIDGGSTDETLEIIQKYEPSLTYWVSEPDRGQSHAINKGFERCTGDIYNWLCSDDLLLPDILSHIAESLDLSGPKWVIGNSDLLDERSKNLRPLRLVTSFSLDNFLRWGSLFIYQPSVFWNRNLHQESGVLSEALHYCMDLDLWWRFLTVTEPSLTAKRLSILRHHDNAKTTPYNPHFDALMAELQDWQISHIFNSEALAQSAEFRKSALKALRELESCQRIREHFVLGRIFRLWRRFVNRDFPAFD